MHATEYVPKQFMCNFKILYKRIIRTILNPCTCTSTYCIHLSSSCHPADPCIMPPTATTMVYAMHSAVNIGACVQLVLRVRALNMLINSEVHGRCSFCVRMSTLKVYFSLKNMRSCTCNAAHVECLLSHTCADVGGDVDDNDDDDVVDKVARQKGHGSLFLVAFSVPRVILPAFVRTCMIVAGKSAVNGIHWQICYSQAIAVLWTVFNDAVGVCLWWCREWATSVRIMSSFASQRRSSYHHVLQITQCKKWVWTRILFGTLHTTRAYLHERTILGRHK